MRILKSSISLLIAAAFPVVLLGCPDKANPDPAAAKASAAAVTTAKAPAPGASAAAPAKSGGW